MGEQRSDKQDYSLKVEIDNNTLVNKNLWRTAKLFEGGLEVIPILEEMDTNTLNDLINENIRMIEEKNKQMDLMEKKSGYGKKR